MFAFLLAALTLRFGLTRVAVFFAALGLLTAWASTLAEGAWWAAVFGAFAVGVGTLARHFMERGGDVR
jgi:hypothetical protein